MKVSQLISLSSTATLVLQCGSFVRASPIFSYPHADELPDANTCQGFRISYPTASGIQYEQHSKHVVAWQAPEGLGQVDLTLVKSDDNSSSQSIGVYDGQRGASDEFTFNAPSGEYRYHLKAQIGQNTCELDSQPFQITAGTEKTDVNDLEAIISSIRQGSSTQSLDDEQLDELLQSIKEGDETPHNNAINQDLAAELQQLSGATDSEDQHSSANHVDGFLVEEHVDDEANDWVDSNVPDHSNEGDWQAEELDTVNFAELEEDDDNDNDIHDDDGDWSSAELSDGEWHSNEISVDEFKAAPEHTNEWHEDSLPDYSNDSSWHSDEIIDEEDHINLVQGDWVDAPSGHPNLVQGDWVDAVSDHPNLVQGSWVDAPANHPNVVQGDWVDTPANHPNVVQGDWVDAPANHANLVQGNWVDAPASHGNLVQGDWVDAPANHANLVQGDWVDKQVGHQNDVPILEAESFIASW
ncbi:hypothetical protein EC973_007792 [Apophysomyces ossiformis]|uniref:Uncharacterized protein n=1 Tax=Apophysomyces ossiformis TaxID=679940 RepID=A0A8H7BTG5_9FUNG|nr:hypothetical protein EC973_007792 [Apophysomyces ossiformis]